MSTSSSKGMRDIRREGEHSNSWKGENLEKWNQKRGNIPLL